MAALALIQGCSFTQLVAEVAVLRLYNDGERVVEDPRETLARLMTAKDAGE